MHRLRLRSLRNKLALLFFGITAAAFAVIYFIVVPQLESNLESRRLQDLRASASFGRAPLEELIASEASSPEINRRVRTVADATDARVTLLSWKESPEGPQGQGRELRFYALSDSREAERAFPRDDALTRRAVLRERSQNGFGAFAGQELAIVAQPLLDRGDPAWVALYSRDLDDVAETVAFIRNRVLVATSAALLLALIGGYLVARALARRVRRLEAAATEVARGRFIEPLPDDSRDELGQLTRTFNEMQEQLRQVDVARKDFIATASHELRTPIFSLAGFVELLQDEDIDEHTRREFLDTMGEQVARLQKLSVDLLDLSRIDAGSLQLHPEPVDLAELARSVVVEFSPAMADHRTDLRVELPPAGPEARCDRERVAQIMRILLDNALRHTPDGTPVTVTASRSNGSVSLMVSDAGPGLSENARGQAFQRFFTGDAARGAGLGLAIAQELAERMEGELHLASGRSGTSFTLDLPTDGGPE
ncbi:MAG TPA: HAMP domain-containing sensor histidine kinase [Thermoleophilaceae bacterium]|nr:HAMP domain-containing sensor histidine kinase [Thermoleophilaceae bacterium]